MNQIYTYTFSKILPPTEVPAGSELEVFQPDSPLVSNHTVLTNDNSFWAWATGSRVAYLFNSPDQGASYPTPPISDPEDSMSPMYLAQFDPVYGNNISPSLTVTNIADVGQLVLGDVIPVPVNAVGTPADKRGMIRVDEEFIYYCVEDYDGANEIWKSIPLTEFKRSFTSGSVVSSMDGYGRQGRPGDKVGDFKLELSGEFGVNVYFCVESYDPTNIQTIWHHIDIPIVDITTVGVGSPYNTAIGQGTLLYNGSYNTAFGYHASASISNGTDNSAVGAVAMQSNTTGSRNTAVGSRSLNSNTVGNSNTAVGSRSLDYNTYGSNNTAVGTHSMLDNTTGERNSALGDKALTSNTIGTYNTAAGYDTMRYNTVGMYNTAVGANALISNQTGNRNTGVGNGSLYNNGHGHNNTGIGASTLLNTTGNGNIGIGALTESGLHAPAFDITNQSNYISMGSTSVTNAYIQVAWTIASDARDKTDFAEIPHGLEFIKQLKPVAYRYKPTRDATSGHGPVRYGFRAQDVLVLEGDAPVIVDATDQDRLRFNDQSLIAVMSKAIQEQQTIIDSLNTRILALEGK